MNWCIKIKKVFSFWKEDLSSKLTPLLEKPHCVLVRTGHSQWLIARADFSKSYYYEIYHRPLKQPKFHRQNSFPSVDGKDSVLIAMEFITSHDPSKQDKTIDIEILTHSYPESKSIVLNRKLDFPILSSKESLEKYINFKYFGQNIKLELILNNLLDCACDIKTPSYYIEGDQFMTLSEKYNPNDYFGPLSYVKRCRNCLRLILEDDGSLYEEFSNKVKERFSGGKVK